MGIYYLSLPSNLILEFKNFYYVSAIARNIILVSYLTMNNGFSFNVKGNSCSFYLNIFYDMGRHDNGLYVLQLNNEILSIHVKKLKLDKAKKSYLWHCRLVYINETRITKLHKQVLTQW